MHLLILDSTESITFPRPDLALTPHWQVSTCTSVAEIEKKLQFSSKFPDVILVYQDRPKQLTQTSVLRLVSTSPLLRLMRVLGPWCDGDLRTPGRLSGVMSLSFREAELQLGKLLEAFVHGKGPLTRPLTSLELAPPLPQSSGKTLRVGVSTSKQLAKSVTASLDALGYEAVQLSGDSSVPFHLDAIIVDGDATPFCVPLVAHPRTLILEGFSRNEGQPCLSKLFSLSDLESALQKLALSK